MVKKNKIRVQITFARDTLVQIDAICNDTGMSRTDYINSLVYVDLADRKKIQKR